MITGELKNKINALWEIFWTGGITNPLDVVEQMTYLMFIRDLDDTDSLKARECAMLGLPHTSIFGGEVSVGAQRVPGSQLKWSVFRDFPAERMYSVVQEQVFPFIKNLHGDKTSAYARYMDDAIFKIPTPLMLDKVVTALDDIYDQMAQLRDGDVRGDVYEFLLSKISTHSRKCSASNSSLSAYKSRATTLPALSSTTGSSSSECTGSLFLKGFSSLPQRSAAARSQIPFTAGISSRHSYLLQNASTPSSIRRSASSRSRFISGDISGTKSSTSYNVTNESSPTASSISRGTARSTNICFLFPVHISSLSLVSVRFGLAVAENT